MRKHVWTIRITGIVIGISLACAILAAGRLGLADIYSTPAQIYLAVRSDASVTEDEAFTLSTDEIGAIDLNLARAHAFTPDDPELMSWMGRMYLYQLVPDELDANDILELGDAAAARFHQALAARPTWAWDWLNLATARYEQFQDGSEEYQLALQRAMQFAPNEPTVHTAVAQLGLDTWSSLNHEAAAAVLDAIEASLRRDDPLLVELAEFSEAWTEVCAAVRATDLAIQQVCRQHDFT